MGPRERPPAVLEELDVTKPAPVDLPLLMEPDRRGKPLFDRGERFDVTLDLEVIDRESGPLEKPPCAGLAVREAGRPARLLPLVGIQRDEGEDLARPERPASPLGDRVGHAEVGRDQVGLERRVLFDLHVADDEPDVRESGGGGLPAGLVDQLGVAIHANHGTTQGSQRQREAARARPGVKHCKLGERFGLETLEKDRAQLIGAIDRSGLSR